MLKLVSDILDHPVCLNDQHANKEENSNWSVAPKYFMNHVKMKNLIVYSSKEL